MDTDELTEMAWNIIVRAAYVSDTLKAQLGVLSGQFQNEDEFWFQGVREHLDGIAGDPDEYVEFWNLEEEENVSASMLMACAIELCRMVDEILTIPLNNRGRREW